MRDSGYSLTRSLWRWNPWYGMYTFIPARGRYFSPFGFYYYAPGSVYRMYESPASSNVNMASGGGYSGSTPRYDSSLGYSTVSRSSNASRPKFRRSSR